MLTAALQTLCTCIWIKNDFITVLTKTLFESAVLVTSPDCSRLFSSLFPAVTHSSCSICCTKLHSQNGQLNWLNSFKHHTVSLTAAAVSGRLLPCVVLNSGCVFTDFTSSGEKEEVFSLRVQSETLYILIREDERFGFIQQHVNAGNC